MLAGGDTFQQPPCPSVKLIAYPVSLKHHHCRGDGLSAENINKPAQHQVTLVSLALHDGPLPPNWRVQFGGGEETWVITFGVKSPETSKVSGQQLSTPLSF